jgi:hypothetical protein
MTSAPDLIPPQVASQLRERGITVEHVPSTAVLDYLDNWRQPKVG